MEDCKVPAPSSPINFSADEIIIYGVELKAKKGVIAVVVTNGGAGYTAASKIEFTGGGAAEQAEANLIIVGGAITEVSIWKPGAGYAVAPIINISAPGAGANLIPVLGEITAIDLEEGQWDIAVKGVFTGKNSENAKNFRLVVAYGYAYEGHCYRFDKFRLIGFAGGRDVGQALGCGFDSQLQPPPANWNYGAWGVKSNKRIIELGLSVGRAEDVILAANLPGRRSPNTYRADSGVAHRGGRLMTSP